MKKIKVTMTKDGKRTENVMPLDAGHCKVLQSGNIAVLVPEAIVDVCKFMLQPNVKINIQTMED